MLKNISFENILKDKKKKKKKLTCSDSFTHLCMMASSGQQENVLFQKTSLVGGTGIVNLRLLNLSSEVVNRTLSHIRQVIFADVSIAGRVIDPYKNGDEWECITS